MHKYKLYLLFFSIFSLFLFTGCGTQSYTLTINEDDSVVLSIRCTVDTGTYNLLSSYSVDVDSLNRKKINNSGTPIDNLEAVFQENASAYQQLGFSITAVNDSIEVGFVAEKTYKTLVEANADIKSLYDYKMSGLQAEITKTETLYKTEYHVYGNLTYLLDPDIDLSDPDTATNFNKIYDKSKLTATLSVKAPANTSISATDGTTSANGTGVTWIAVYDNGNKTVDTHVISIDYNVKAYVFTIIVVIALICTATYFIRKAWLKRKEKLRVMKVEASLNAFTDSFEDDYDDFDDEDNDET